MSLVKADNSTHRHTITRQRVRVICDRGQPTNAWVGPPLPPWLLIEYHPLLAIYISTHHGYRLLRAHHQWTTLRIAMAQSTTKRKRTQTRTKPNKRPKYVDCSDPSSDDDSKLWEAECILEERIVKGVKKYHIKWKGTDPSTGRAWPTTWEPEENANDELVADWLQKKAHESGGSRGRSRQRTEAQALRRIRNLRVIDSSPESTCSPSTPSHHRAASGNLSSATHSTVGVAAAPGPVLRISPRIRIRRRGQSLERDEFERVSQIPLSQPPSTQEPTQETTQVHIQETDIDSLQLISARPEPYSSGIVPDSQSSTGEASFIPITQQIEDTNQQSTDSSRVLEEEEDIADDSVRSQCHMQQAACFTLLTDIHRGFSKSSKERRCRSSHPRGQFQRL